MAIVRVEMRLHLASAPPVGKWNQYSKAYFETSTTTPDLSVLEQLENLFRLLAVDRSNPQLACAGIDATSGAGLFTLHTWDGEVLVAAGTYPFTPAVWSFTAAVSLPSQCQIAVGYRAPIVGNVQQGRSRFWVGPLEFKTGGYILGHGLNARIASGTVDTLAGYAQDVIGELASLGWVLQVKSKVGGVVSFAAANEVYIDDVLDTMRSRKTYTSYQARLDL